MELIRHEQGGRLSTAAIIEDARDEGSPFHKYFEWDDPVAAEKWRAEQAGQLIRGIVTVVTRGDVSHSIRAFVNVTEGQEHHYTTTAHALSDDGLREQVLRKAWEELQGWYQRYREYKELSVVFAAVEQAALDAPIGARDAAGRVSVGPA